MSSYIETLAGLAGKRRQLTDVIVNLAAVAGVDPSPYLDVPAKVTDAEVNRVVDDLKAQAKKDPPPRPQRPASPTTNGTGRALTVADAKTAAILAALKKHGDPMTPAELAEALGLTRGTLRYQLNPLIAAGQVKAKGKTMSRRLTLA